MTEKDNDSMATVQIKPDYAASEVYSTASEAPPAYKRQANSVKIAKITAFTVIISSFILGSFILASSYLQAKASCDQVQALDSVLEKELMLETLQQVNKEYPRAEALMGKENNINNEIDLQNIEKDETKKEEEPKQQQMPPLSISSAAAAVNGNSESDSSFSESEEAEDLQKISNKVPLELDLSDLAAALLQNNQKSRMNCVVERKRAEEILDSPSKTVTLPFGMNLTTDPKKARVTGERISIFCEGGNEKNKDQQQGRQNNRESDDEDDDDAEDIVENFRGPMFFPIQPIPFGRTPNQSPLTHMPQRMIPPQFQQLPIRQPMPQQMMQAPQPQFQPQQQTVRIHVQEIPFRAIHMADDVPVQIPSVRQDVPHYQVQKVPLDVALYRAGITSEDLRNIQHMAEERITDELRRLDAEEAAEASNDFENANRVEEESAQSSSGEQEQQHQQQQLPQQRQQPQQQIQQQQQQRPQQIQVQIQREQSREQPAPPQHLVMQHQQLPEQPRDTMVPPMPDQPQPMIHFGRAAYGRSLVQPVSIPVPMMQPHPEMTDETNESERPHYVQPRSIRSTDNLFQPESKRVKKCACECSC